MSLEFTFAFQPRAKIIRVILPYLFLSKNVQDFFFVYILVKNCEKKLLLQYAHYSDICLSTHSKNPLKSSACTVLSHWLTDLFPA